MRRRVHCLLIACMVNSAPGVLAPAVHAQTGTGRTGAAVLQLAPGTRAAAMGGAYVAGGDADALFYNPAAVVGVRAAASLSWQQHVEDIGYGSAAVGVRIGPAAMALTAGFLDYGSIAEVLPDPAFGGQRGVESGESVDAAEVVGRAALATSLLDGRLAVGAAGGLVWVAIAETGRVTPVFDAGAQLRVNDAVAVGAALRNAGGRLDGARLGAVDLPTELRAGARYAATGWARGLTTTVHADVVAPLVDGKREGGGLAIGVEAALPTSRTGPQAAIRAGFDGSRSSGAAGRLHVGAGLSFGRFDVDYAFQSMDVLGAVHRFGLRWQR